MPRRYGFAVVELIVILVVAGIAVLGIATWYIKRDQPVEEFIPDAEHQLTPRDQAPTNEPTIAIETPTVAPPTSTPSIKPTTAKVNTATTAPTTTPLPPIAIPPTSTPVPTATPQPSCISNPNPTFTSNITDLAQVNYIVAPPTMGSGPSLKPHSYIGTDHANVPIYAPVAMTFIGGAYFEGGPYTLEFQVSCEVKIRFGHVTDPVPAIRSLFPATPAGQNASQTYSLPNVSFGAGELVANTTGTTMAGNWDFGVYNSVTSNRYANDPNWNTSTTYTTAVCPFAYFTPELKAIYYSKFNPTILSGNPPDGESFCL